MSRPRRTTLARASRFASLVLGAGALGACAGATPAPASAAQASAEGTAPSSSTAPPTPGPAESAATAPPGAGSAAAATSGTAPSAADSETANAKPGEAQSDSSKASESGALDADASSRELKYVNTAEGLKISVSGVRFMAKAWAERSGGGWGVKLSVGAQSSDGKPHSWQTPKGGPLALAVSVTRKGKSEPERFGDRREGDGEQAIGAHSVLASRAWPPAGTPALSSGDALDMDVGLWGLGDDAASRRPVKRFFHVRMQVDKGKPRPRVEPPAAFKSD